MTEIARTWIGHGYELRAMVVPESRWRVLLLRELNMRTFLTNEPLELWLCVGTVDVAMLDETAADVLGGGAEQRAVIHMGLLIHGALWEKVEPLEEAVRQAETWSNAPEGIARVREPIVRLTRGVAFGDDFTRVMRALEAVADAFDVGGSREAYGPEARRRIAASKSLSVQPHRGLDQ